MGENATRVLLVEDDLVFRDILARHFQSRNSTMVHAGSGKEALASLDKEAPFDVILLDVALPDMDGFDILSHIHGNPKVAKVPVIVVSNFVKEKDISWGRALGAVQFIQKSAVMPGEIVDAALKACAATG